MSDQTRSEQNSIVRPAPVTLTGLLDELCWPRLLRAPRLALRPDRLGLGVIGIVVIGLLGTLPSLWDEGPGLLPLLVETKIEGLMGVTLGVLSLDVARIADGLDLLSRLPGRIWSEYPVSAIVLGVPILVVWAIVGGGISRSAACDHAQGVRIDWPRALGFGLSRWFGFSAALVSPLVVAGVLLVGVVIAGGVLFALPGLRIIGALLYPLMLLAGALAAFALAVWVFAGAMLVPAVACEGTDAIDSVQRSYNYAVTRPLRLIAYLAILVVTGIVTVGGGVLLARATVVLTASAAGAVLGSSADAVLAGESMGGADGVASFLVGMWSGIPLLLVSGYAVSYFFSASTLLYLLMRRVVDGQDASEIWMPGLIEGTLAEAFESGSSREIAEMDAEPE